MIQMIHTYVTHDSQRVILGLTDATELSELSELALSSKLSSSHDASAISSENVSADDAILPEK